VALKAVPRDRTGDKFEGEVVLADGDIEHAQKVATTAAATAAEYGCAGLSKRAATLLAHI
jgi:hypothetical protein